MKVLLVTRKLPPPTTLGAVPTIVGAMADGLAEAGIEVSVVAGPPSKARVESPRKRLTVYRVDDESRGRILQLAPTIGRLWKDVDLVHIHDVLPLGTDFLDWVAHSPVPRFWTMHNFQPLCANSFLWPPCSLAREDIPSGPPDLCYVDRSPDCRKCFAKGIRGRTRYSAFLLRNHLARRAASRFNLITPSRASAKVIMRAWGLRTRILANPIAMGNVGNPRKPGDVLSIFFGGRLVPEKGLDVLIKSMGQLKGVCAKLTVSGSGRPGYLDALADLARKNGILYRQVSWLPRDRYLHSLKEHDICVVPTSGFEVFGMVALDAQMVGLPLVLADRGGLREVARSGKNALYFEPGDARSLADAIRSLAADSFMRSRFALRSRKIARRYDLHGHLKRLLTIYDEAMLPHA